jgi:hypothetical protein
VANFPSAGITLADDATLPEVIKALRFIATQQNRNIANSVRQVQADPRMKDERVAYALRSLAHNIEIVDMGRGIEGDVLYLVNRRQAAFGSPGNPGPGGTVPAAGNGPLLDAVHNADTVAQAVSRGSLIYGNATPKWDELVIGANKKVLASNGTDAAWTALDQSYIADRVLREWLPMQMGWVLANGTVISATVLGTYPDVYQGYQFVDAPPVAPQGVLYQWKMPKQWASGTVEAKMLYRMIAVGLGANSQFEFRLRTLSYSPGASPVGAATTVTTIVAHPGEYANTHEQSLGTFTATADQMVRIVLDRNTAGTDDTTDSVNVIGVALEYTADS